MKRGVYLTIYFLLISVFAKAQQSDKKLEMHYYVGPTINNVFKSEYGNTGITEKVKNSFGFNLGVLPYWKFSKFLHLRFGLGYNLRNFKYELTGFILNNPNSTGVLTASSKNKLIIHEIQLPFHLVIHPPNKGLYGFVGGDFCSIFKGSSKNVFNYSDGTKNSFENTLESQFNPAFEFGVGNNGAIGASKGFRLEIYFSILTKNISQTDKRGQSIGLKLIY